MTNRFTRVFVYEHLSSGCAGTAGGAELLAQGVAMRDAMVAELRRIADVAVSCAVTPGEQVGGDDVACCERRPGESANEFVYRQAVDHHACWIVAPESEGTLLALRRAAGERWMGCDSSAIALTASKRATARHLAQLGFRTPIWGGVPAAGLHQGQRWIVKPDDGAGAEGAHCYEDAAHALGAWCQRRTAGEAVVLEPWIEGVPISASLLCRTSGTEVLSINRQKICVAPEGDVHFDGVEINFIDLTSESGRTISKLALEVARSLPGLAGFVGIDLVLHPWLGPFVIEINPRVTSAYPKLTRALRRNLAQEILGDHRVRRGIRDAAVLQRN